jgi:hypothetical protein
MGKFIFYHMLQVFNRMKVVILPPYIPSQAEKDRPTLFANNVRKAMSKVLQVPYSDHSIEDNFISHHSRSAGVKQTFTMAEISRIYSLNVAQVKELLVLFRKVDSDKTGYIDITDFCRTFRLNLPPTSFARSLFAFFDTDATGYIDFVSMLYGLSLLRDDCPLPPAAALVFRLYDDDDDGMVTVERIKQRFALFNADLRRLEESSEDAGHWLSEDGVDRVLAQIDKYFHTDGGSNFHNVKLNEFVEMCKATPGLLQIPRQLIREHLIHKMGLDKSDPSADDKKNMFT